MKRVLPLLAMVAFGALLALSPAGAQTCSIGGHNETSENFATGGWGTTNMSPGTVSGAPFAFHLVISEVAPRGAGTGAASDSSEYLEIYNPTPNPISLNGKYISDDIGYYKVVNGLYAVANTSDFNLKFPAGLMLLPGRTLVLCVTKAGFFGSGASAAAAQIFLEMKDSNQNTTDDMIPVATGTTFPVTGGMFTNPATTNGEWIVLYCWDGASDRVCDVDYASWGANSASNPKMSKTGISIDGPDAGAATSAYNPDTAPATQTNLGSATTLTRPLTYQRTGGEVGEATFGGNGCLGIVTPNVIGWLPVLSATGVPDVRFHVRWTNTDDDAMSGPVTAQMRAQEFGVFLPDLGLIGEMNVPPLQPNSFFDVFIEVPLSSLPPSPQKIVPGSGGGLKQIANATYGGGAQTQAMCPPDTNWAGNVDIQWTGTPQGGQVNKHYSDLLTCAGGAPSYIHFRPSNCTTPMPWAITGLCPGFTSTLVNEDFTPAPNPVPVGWSGWICVQAAAGALGSSCCFGVTFQCAGVSSTIDICTFACQCAPTPGPNPQPSTIGWTNVPGSTDIRFHVRWTNPSTALATAAATGQMMSQEFGVFAPNFGLIGQLNIPPIQPNSFFDVFFDVPLTQLPPSAAISGGPSSNVVAGGKGSPMSTLAGPCPPDTSWAGNVDLNWTSTAGTAQVNYHFGDLQVCPGSGKTYIHVREVDCPSGTPAAWSIAGLCPGFSATLVNENYSAAPNPVPPGWSGWICVSAAAATPVPVTCCFTVTFLCDNVPGVITVCATTCQCHTAPAPVPSPVTWTTLAGTSTVQFHQTWSNPNDVVSAPVSGQMSSQEFGVFLPNSGPIGHFDVPAMQAHSFFDVFLDMPLTALPPNPPTQGGPGTGAPCPPNTHWNGNVDVVWNGPAGGGQANYHIGDITVCPGGGASLIHIKSLVCADPAGMPWAITGLCPGFSATLQNEDHSPAPNPVPLGWTGWISVTAAAGTPVPDTCCFKVKFLCDGVPGVIDLCAITCQCGPTPVNPVPGTVDWTAVPAIGAVRFHIRWTNPSGTQTTVPVSGSMNSQPFGAFAPNFGPIGQFTVPPIQPSSFFDVFFEVPLSQLPPQPQQQFPGGGPQPGSPCPPDTSWSGNVDINWAGAGGVGQVNRHFTSLLVRPGFGSSHVHTLIFCNSTTGSPWTIAGLCPGFSATLLNEDFTPAPNPVPPNWTGWISVAAANNMPGGVSCCFTVTFTCDGEPGVIDVCAATCLWRNTGVPINTEGLDFGIYATAPNPTSSGMAISFAMPKSGAVRLDIYNLSGQRVRTLLDGQAEAGLNTVRWDGRGSNNRALPPGAYFVTLRAGERVANKKIVVFH